MNEVNGLHGEVVEAKERALLLKFSKNGCIGIAVALKDLCYVGNSFLSDSKEQLRLGSKIQFSAVLDHHSWKPDVWKVVAAWTKKKPFDAYLVQEWKEVSSLYKNKVQYLWQLELLSKKRITERGVFEPLEKSIWLDIKTYFHLVLKLRSNSAPGASNFCISDKCLYFKLFGDASYDIRKFVCDEYPNVKDFIERNSAVFSVSENGFISLVSWMDATGRSKMDRSIDTPNNACSSFVTHASQLKNNGNCGEDILQIKNDACLKLNDLTQSNKSGCDIKAFTETQSEINRDPIKNPFPRAVRSVQAAKDPERMENKVDIETTDRTEKTVTMCSFSSRKHPDFSRFLMPVKAAHSTYEKLANMKYKEGDNDHKEVEECSLENETIKSGAAYQLGMESMNIKTSRDASTQTLSSGPVMSMAHLIID